MKNTFVAAVTKFIDWLEKNGLKLEFPYVYQNSYFRVSDENPDDRNKIAIYIYLKHQNNSYECKILDYDQNNNNFRDLLNNYVNRTKHSIIIQTIHKNSLCVEILNNLDIKYIQHIDIITHSSYNYNDERIKYVPI